MRLALAIPIVVVASCGVDYQPRAPGPDAATAASDGAPTDATGGATGGATDGGADAGSLTICEQATLHSDLAWIQDNIFSASCAHGSCHTTSGQAGGLDLSTGQARADLVDRPTSTLSGWIRVVAGNPGASYLLVAIGGASGPMPQGGYMPWGAAPLCPEETDAIRRWIAAGAQP